MIDTSANSSFSKSLPGLQLAVDSTSLGAFKKCPRYYQYSIIEGWQPRETSVHLTFGLLMHGANERYYHAKATLASHEEALDLVVDWVLRETWDFKLGRPWISDHKIKNRLTLLRTVIWYLDQYGDNDSLETLHLANGKPAVELSFRFDSGYRYASTGEAILFCGHLDRLASLNGVVYIPDIKTTGSTISPSWFASFSPDNQFSMYNLAGQIAFDQPTAGVILDGAQVGVNFSRFERHLVQRHPDTVAEWHRDAGRWLREMETSALEQIWPMNDKACNLYGGCEFRGICSRAPGTRETWLKTNFKKRIWDPLQIRGDI